jgi:DNA-nicking Smr family endonuclease
VARKKKPTTTGPATFEGDAEDEDGGAPARPLQKIPQKLASPFATALAGVKAAPARAKVAPAPAKGAPRSFAAALAARAAAPSDASAPNVSKAAPLPGKARSFAEALEVRERGEAPEAKAAERSLAERTALRNAFAGVQPLGERDKRRVALPPLGDSQPVRRGEKPDTTDLDADARKRLAGLVAGALRFDVRTEEDGRVEGMRVESGGRVALDEGALARLSRAATDGELDLHGQTGDEAELLVARWVRARHRAGARVVRLVHGKGLHSDGGVSVLRERVVQALTEGGAAPLVLGFVSAAPQAGGTGALVVQLAGRG